MDALGRPEPRRRVSAAGLWWAAAAAAILGVAVCLAVAAPVEIAGLLAVAAAVSVLAAGVCTRRRRAAGWPDSAVGSAPRTAPH